MSRPPPPAGEIQMAVRDLAEHAASWPAPIVFGSFCARLRGTRLMYMVRVPNLAIVCADEFDRRR